MVELLVIRFGEWLRIRFSGVDEAEAAAEAAYDEYPGPYAPEAIFVDGKLYKSLNGDDAIVDLTGDATVEAVYATARAVDEED
jgi:hypothetical protein